ncbi:hypothetical protein AOZ07_02855 [Glutamicibacter halophytocola]|uniref:DUF7446 family protein n=1 Tax=Glutamicibacter halophytocola TaxID=1933880 RepID=UPI0006D4AC84|nr:hypothetical protein [Glutamicibacter halophytocola]ALG28040.1 hypothetical protein AOZ07_02855 [Glutamicibacter halophytocola]
MSNKIGIHFAPFSKEIQAGRLNKAGNVFLGEKQTVTDECIGAVAEYVEANYGGGVEFTYPGVGLKVEIKVTRIEKEAEK